MSRTSNYFQDGWYIFRGDPVKLEEIDQIIRVRIHRTVTVIPNDAFHFYSDNHEDAYLTCGNLKEVVFHKGTQLRSIGLSAFGECRSLESFRMPNSVTVLRCDAFDLSNKLTEIPYVAFGDCFSLRNLELPDSIQYIGASAFYHCKSLERLKLPISLLEIRVCAFIGCGNLKLMEFPASLVSIDVSAFYSCKKLTTIKFAKTGPRTIADEAFPSCPVLVKIQFTSMTRAILLRLLEGQCLKRIGLYTVEERNDVPQQTTNGLYTVTKERHDDPAKKRTILFNLLRSHAGLMI